MIAKRAGSASCGAIVPFPISVPINVPTICAITAPGPSKADKPGIEQITPRATSPKTFHANGVNSLANALPKPEPLMIPTSKDTNAMNGRSVVIHV